MLARRICYVLLMLLVVLVVAGCPNTALARTRPAIGIKREHHQQSPKLGSSLLPARALLKAVPNSSKRSVNLEQQEVKQQSSAMTSSTPLKLYARCRGRFCSREGADVPK